MKEPLPKTHTQVKAIFGEAKRQGVDKDALHEVVLSVTNRTGSIAALTHAEAQNVIARLKGKAAFIPLRTLQYRRQKAGVKVMVQEWQLKLIAELASQREWSPQSLAKFCLRQCKHETPLTSAHANSVIEALKSMNKREGLWAA